MKRVSATLLALLVAGVILSIEGSLVGHTMFMKRFWNSYAIVLFAGIGIILVRLYFYEIKSIGWTIFISTLVGQVIGTIALIAAILLSEGSMEKFLRAIEQFDLIQVVEIYAVISFILGGWFIAGIAVAVFCWAVREEKRDTTP